MSVFEDVNLQSLREHLAKLESEKRNLEDLLQLTTQHYDEIGRGFLDSYRETTASYARDILALNRKVELLEHEKLDLEAMMEASAGQLDVMEDALLERIRNTIAASEKRFRTITEALPIPLLVTRLEGGAIVYANAQASAFFGIPGERLLGLHGLDLLHEEDRARIRDMVLMGENPRNQEVRGDRQDGSRFWALLTVAHFTFNETPCLLSLWQDITERRELEARLRQSHKMEAIGTFASGIAHDFNNILSVIFGYAQLCQFDLPEGHAAGESLGKILSAATRAKDLISQILTFARMDEREMKPLRVAPVVKEVAEQERQVMPGSIHIDLEIRAKDAIVLGDQTQLHQVLMNLCTNAVDAMRECGGFLRVSLSEVGASEIADLALADLKPASRYVLLEVADTGHGIPKEILGKIFDPFFTTKQAGKGTGMGLSVVHGVVKNHQGGIVVESSPMAGTTFRIILPASSGSRPEAEDRSRGLEIRTGSEHVLIASDRLEVAEAYRGILERIGYRVEVCSLATAVPEEIEGTACSFQLAVVEESLVRQGGEGFVARLKQARPSLPVLLIVENRERMTEIHAGPGQGIDAVLAKPCTLEEITGAMRSLLDVAGP